MKLPYGLLVGCAWLTACSTPPPTPDVALRGKPLIEVDALCGEDPICVSTARLQALPCTVASDHQSLRLASSEEVLAQHASGIDLPYCVAFDARPAGYHPRP